MALALTKTPRSFRSPKLVLNEDFFWVQNCCVFSQVFEGKYFLKVFCNCWFVFFKGNPFSSVSMVRFVRGGAGERTGIMYKKNLQISCIIDPTGQKLLSSNRMFPLLVSQMKNTCLQIIVQSWTALCRAIPVILAISCFNQQIWDMLISSSKAKKENTLQIQVDYYT